jgi:tryptophanyl-tRNA synthetase
MNNLPEVDALLQKGAEKAHLVANEVLKRVRVKLGFE